MVIGNKLFKIAKSLMFLSLFLIIGFQSHDIEILKKEIIIRKEMNKFYLHEIEKINGITNDIIVEWNDAQIERRLWILDFEGIE